MRTHQGHVPNLDNLPLREHVMTVDCRRPPHGCGEKAGDPCRNVLTGQLLPGIGHPLRLSDADADAEITRPPVMADDVEPAPARRLVSADRIRRDLAHYRQACDYCTAPIVWATNGKGDLLPVDADPDAEAGHLWLVVDDRGVRASALNRRQAAGAREQGKRLHRPHRKSCPKRLLWSRHA